ncbi:MAG TPA: FAD/NAD(P)-binding oxidoreductase [Anaerolineaceae bacterium]|nr:FAD/NAD(P)-binding oxidoreductase [Anaerolineaceae bacterium]
MKTFLVLGAGTAGTMIARKMASKLDLQQWKVIVVDKETRHFYQPGFLFVPFGWYKPEQVVKPIKNFIARNVELIRSDIELIEPDANKVTLANKQVISYDYLVIATGCDIHPEQTEGMVDGGGWRQNIFDFYTFEGAVALSKFLNKWEGGRMVVNVSEMPIKCPVAPLEFLFLADWYFSKKGIRNKVELVYATPLSGAFTKPVASDALGALLAKKNIQVEPDYNIGSVDSGRNVIASYDEREIPYDLLVTIPTNMGADVIARSGMGDVLNFVPTDKYTLQSEKYPNIWVMGDANNIPASKAGAVIHFQMETVVKNLLAHIQGKELHEKFDGHASCYIESGFAKAVLIDFSYDQEPLPGKYPVPGIGPFTLLGESTINHWGKMGFRFMYWYLMLKGIEVPLPSKFSMAGKKKI